MRKLGNQTTSWISGLAGKLVVFSAAAMLSIAPAHAQSVESFDPDEAFETATNAGSNAAGQVANQASGAIDADLANPNLRDNLPDNLPSTPSFDPNAPMPVPTGNLPTSTSDIPGAVVNQSGFDNEFSQYSGSQTASDVASAAGSTLPSDAPTQASSDTYGQDDLIGAAEGVFGKGAQGLAGLIEDLLREQGEPNGYIVGREGGGAFIFGVRYGSGTLHHRIEGERKLYWTGPSLGFDAGANAGNTFVLVYNLFDTQDIFRRYPAGEGQAYFVGGMHASYMRRGDVVLIPIRVGAGLRLGVNAGYMRFSEKHRWLPF